ncbi:MAG: ABC transporter ATP-binding protein [Chloroflexota bacterium]
MIQTTDLAKRFGAKTAVKDLNLAIGKGEVFGFLGPNGAGKTTTVRMLACLVAPTSGTARLGSLQVGRDDGEIRRHIGILTESPGLYERFSAAYNLDFYARLYGLSQPRRAQQVERYLRLLGLWERRHEPSGTFSKGMKQKLAIARALIHEPDVVFLDEPTAALDPESAHTVREFIAGLRAEGRTIFLCTHNLDEAERLCDRIAIMRGTVIAEGAPADLRRRLYGSRTVLTLARPCPAAEAALAALGMAVEARDNLLAVAADDPDAQNPTIVRAAVEAGAAIRYVAEERASLEEVYLKLVREGEGGA